MTPGDVTPAAAKAATERHQRGAGHGVEEDLDTAHQIDRVIDRRHRLRSRDPIRNAGSRKGDPTTADDDNDAIASSICSDVRPATGRSCVGHVYAPPTGVISRYETAGHAICYNFTTPGGDRVCQRPTSAMHLWPALPPLDRGSTGPLTVAGTPRTSHLFASGLPSRVAVDSV